MSVLVVVMVALLGGTAWVVQDQPWAARPALQRRLAEAGLTLSVLAGRIPGRMPTMGAPARTGAARR
ncbi:hypothetical protein [Actinoplanes sp. URMC 104]|uniref:hypothetical protein n=1 Tax=Actinoplanes sp. URMC 104 TaxID=3423409 RepID=UPI003F1CCD13